MRGDLIRILNKLLKRRSRFDAIMIETTGLANPAPVIQTFYVDDDIKVRNRATLITGRAQASRKRLTDQCSVQGLTSREREGSLHGDTYRHKSGIHPHTCAGGKRVTLET